MTDLNTGDVAERATAILTRAPAAAPQRESRPPSSGARLGEELPIFCERCGYSLNGLAQIRCDRCQVLHFACPECDHHQPINTLRPAVQRALGRLRSLGLALIVFLKINYFFWCLFAWGALGNEIAYRYDYIQTGPNGMSVVQRADADLEVVIAVFLFAMAFAMIGRMLLLRWRWGVLVGLTIGALTATAMYAGAYLRYTLETRSSRLPLPGGDAFITYLISVFLGGIAGGAVVWLLWRALAYTFLPRRAATSLITYQYAMSAPPGAKDPTDAATSVVA